MSDDLDMGGDLSNDAVGDIGDADMSDGISSDFGGDLASDEGMDLGDDFDSDVAASDGVDSEDDFGQDLTVTDTNESPDGVSGAEILNDADDSEDLNGGFAADTDGEPQEWNPDEDIYPNRDDSSDSIVDNSIDTDSLDNTPEVTDGDVGIDDNSSMPDLTAADVRTASNDIQQEMAHDAELLDDRFAEQTDAPYQGEDIHDPIDMGDAQVEQLDSVLDNFQESNWRDLSLADQEQSMTDLANYVADETGNTNPPEVVFRNDMGEGEYGGYNPDTNILEVNENLLDDSGEAADTVAHEMWHAYQQQCALDPTSEKGREYQEGFDNYISPEYDFEGYQDQMVEAEAREYAQGFKDRLSGMKGAI